MLEGIVVRTCLYLAFINLQIQEPLQFSYQAQDPTGPFTAPSSASSSDPTDDIPLEFNLGNGHTVTSDLSEVNDGPGLGSDSPSLLEAIASEAARHHGIS